MAYETEVWNLLSKPNDFKVCCECGAFNWYENEECIMCFEKKFKKITQKAIKDEIKFWEDEGYKEPLMCYIEV